MEAGGTGWEGVSSRCPSRRASLQGKKVEEKVVDEERAPGGHGRPGNQSPQGGGVRMDRPRGPDGRASVSGAPQEEAAVQGKRRRSEDEKEEEDDDEPNDGQKPKAAPSPTEPTRAERE